eukprot:s2439_g4.t1
MQWLWIYDKHHDWLEVRAIEGSPGKFEALGVAQQKGRVRLEITELPVKRWTQDYKDWLLEQLPKSGERRSLIEEIREQTHADPRRVKYRTDGDTEVDTATDTDPNTHADTDADPRRTPTRTAKSLDASPCKRSEEGLCVGLRGSASVSASVRDRGPRGSAWVCVGPRGSASVSASVWVLRPGGSAWVRVSVRVSAGSGSAGSAWVRVAPRGSAWVRVGPRQCPRQCGFCVRVGPRGSASVSASVRDRGPRGSAWVCVGPRGSAWVRVGPRGSTWVRMGPRGCPVGDANPKPSIGMETGMAWHLDPESAMFAELRQLLPQQGIDFELMEIGGREPVHREMPRGRYVCGLMLCYDCRDRTSFLRLWHVLCRHRMDRHMEISSSSVAAKGALAAVLCATKLDQGPSLVSEELLRYPDVFAGWEDTACKA